MSGIPDSWRVFGGEPLGQTVFNLRFIKDDGGPAVNKVLRGKDFPNIEQFAGVLESTIKKFNDQEYKAYVNMNPLNPDFNAYACSDADILKRSLLLIDIDGISDTRQPATDQEVDQAKDIANAIQGFLANEDWATPTITDSGNGVHMYYHLEDVANTPEDRELIKKTLYQLHHLFSTDTHKIDTSVHNAGRITKLLGTKAYKGKASKARPVRTSKLLKESKGKVTREQLKTFCDGFESKEPALKANGAEPPSQVPVKLEGFDALVNQPLLTKSLEQERSDLREALEHLSPDAEHGIGKFEGGQYWSAVILSIASQGDEFRDIALEWSRPGNTFTEAAFKKCWDSHDPNATGHEGKTRTIASLYGYVNQITGKGKALPSGLNPLERLRAMSSTGKSKEMRKRMLDDKFIMKDMAILGQSTAIAAPPNAGKTLKTIHALIETVKSGEIRGEDIFYVNADDHGKGAVEKIEIVEPYGINMLIPNESGFKSADLLQIIREMIEQDQARGQIVILDTLKKFTDLMDKKASTEFTKQAREFELAGGSLILLMHCNKGRDKHGKLIVAGTSDIVDDVDCVFVFDPVGEHEGVHTIECEMRKCRGDVASTLSFQYTRQTGQTYAELLDSVKPLDEIQLEFARETETVRHRLEENAPVIKVIERHIIENNKLEVPRTKTELIKHIATDAQIGEKKVRKVMNYHEGDDYDKGYRWTSIKVGNERTEFKLLDLPPSS